MVFKKPLFAVFLYILLGPLIASNLDLLDIPPTAKGRALRGGLVGMGGDSNSFFINPAGPALLKTLNISATHIELGQNVRYETLAVSAPFMIGTFSAGINYMQSGYMSEIENYQDTGRNFFYYLASGIAGFSFRPIDRISIGFGLRFTVQDFTHGKKNDDLEKYTVMGIGGNIGAMVQIKLKKSRKDWGLRFGLSGSNIGASWMGTMYKDMLPISINGGFYFEYKFIGITLNFIKRFDTKDISSIEASIGSEFFKDSFFIPRVSLSFKNTRFYVDAGLGVRLQYKKLRFSLDYAVDPLSFIYTGNMGHTFSIEFMKMITELIPLWNKMKKLPRNKNPYQVILADFVNIGRVKPVEEEFDLKLYRAMLYKLNAHPNVHVRDRNKVYYLLKTWQLLPKALYDDDFVVNLGKKLQSNFLVRGTYKIKNGVIWFRIQIYDIETDSIYKDFRIKGYDEGGFEDILDDISTRIFFAINDYLNYLVKLQEKAAKEYQKQQKLKDKLGAEKMIKRMKKKEERDKKKRARENAKKRRKKLL